MEQIKLLATLLGYLGVIAGFVTALWKGIGECRKIREGLKCQLRSGMLHTYYKHRHSLKIRQYELENFLLMYKAYKAMKGNSFIDEIYEEVKAFGIET